jgi:hypothetical protein
VGTGRWRSAAGARSYRRLARGLAVAVVLQIARYVPWRPMGLLLSSQQVVRCPEPGCGHPAVWTDHSPPKCTVCERVFAIRRCHYCAEIAGSRRDGYWACPNGDVFATRVCPVAECRAFGERTQSGIWVCLKGHPFEAGHCPQCGEWASKGTDGVWRCDVYDHGEP